MFFSFFSFHFFQFFIACLWPLDLLVENGKFLAKNSMIQLKNIWKPLTHDLKIRLLNSLVLPVTSNDVRLWRMDFEQRWRKKIGSSRNVVYQRLHYKIIIRLIYNLWFYRKLLRIHWIDRRTKKCTSRPGVERELLLVIRRRMFKCVRHAQKQFI